MDSLRPVACPNCGNAADAMNCATNASTDGPVTMVRVTCVDRRWYLMPADRLTDLS